MRPPRKDARALGTLDVNALRSPVWINVTDKASWPNCGGDWAYWLLCGSLDFTPTRIAAANSLKHMVGDAGIEPATPPV